MNYKWNLLCKDVGYGHKIFRDQLTKHLAIADQSGVLPHQTDDGVLWIAPLPKSLEIDVRNLNDGCEPSRGVPLEVVVNRTGERATVTISASLALKLARLQNIRVTIRAADERYAVAALGGMPHE